MTHTRRVLAHALGAAVVLAPALGWTTYKAVTANRSFQGRIEVWFDRQLSSGERRIVDSFTNDGFSFEATVAQVAGGKEVTTNRVLSGKTAKGKPFTARLVGPAKLNADLKTGSVMLDLPFRWTVNGRTVEKWVKLSTDASIPGPKGRVTGQRMKIRNNSSPVRLVGETTTSAEDVASSEQEILELSEAKQQRDLIEERQGNGSPRKRQPDAIKQGSNRTPLRLMLIVDGQVRALSQAGADRR